MRDVPMQRLPPASPLAENVSLEQADVADKSRLDAWSSNAEPMWVFLVFIDVERLLRRMPDANSASAFLGNAISTESKEALKHAHVKLLTVVKRRPDIFRVYDCPLRGHSRVVYLLNEPLSVAF